ncbi:expressed protein [Phakopsora pachyrhizi]|uniref:Expressed protein n=1 Tax=Phakopsora pachyrhizi TaxID=170000 RepID=A0AAV0B245_PHAPC|nr:expressed protein [Phakopsora pachyrhizi]
MIRDEAHCSCEVGATDCRTSCSRVDLTSYSLCEQSGQSRIPLSLQKLLNPIKPSSSSALTAYHRQELVTSSSNVSLPGDSKSVADLSQLRPWTRLPPPPMVTSHRKTNLPSLCLYIPVHLPHELSPFQWSPESPVSPQLTPNQLTPPSTCEEEPGRLEIGECQYSAQKWDDCSSQMSSKNAPDVTPTALLFSPVDKSLEKEEATLAKGLNFKFRSSACRPSLSSRTRRKTSLKKVNKSNEKDRNRCLTCGSSFSTFANLTRHEKKCALVAPKVET